MLKLRLWKNLYILCTKSFNEFSKYSWITFNETPVTGTASRHFDKCLWKIIQVIKFTMRRSEHLKQIFNQKNMCCIQRNRVCCHPTLMFPFTFRDEILLGKLFYVSSALKTAKKAWCSRLLQWFYKQLDSKQMEMCGF